MFDSLELSAWRWSRQATLGHGRCWIKIPSHTIQGSHLPAHHLVIELTWPLQTTPRSASGNKYVSFRTRVHGRWPGGAPEVCRWCNSELRYERMCLQNLGQTPEFDLMHLLFWIASIKWKCMNDSGKSTHISCWDKISCKKL
jgi:hypothetical protein